MWVQQDAAIVSEGGAKGGQTWLPTHQVGADRRRSPTCSLPSVVEYYGAFHDEAHLFIVMEYCGGGDLLEKLLRDKKVRGGSVTCEGAHQQREHLPQLSATIKRHLMRPLPRPPRRR